MKETGKRWIAVAVAAVLLLLLPLAVKTNYVLILIDQSLINVICVLGLNYITGLTGQTNLGMGAIFGLGAYTSALLSVRCGLNPFLCLPAVILMGLIIGQSLGRPSLRVNGIFLALTTISFGEIIRLLLTNMQGLTYGTLGVSRIPSYSIAGISFSTPRSFYYLALIFTVVSIILCNRIVNSRWGGN